MAERIVTQTFRSNEGDILVIGNPEEPWRQRQKDWAIADILSGRHQYFVGGEAGTLRPIDVINDPDGLYLRARADSNIDNNLDNLPELDILPWEVAIDDAEILVVHAALVSHGNEGQILMMGGSEHNSAQENEFLNTRIYDISENRLININSPEADVFCCEHAFLSDGRLLIGGGTESWIHTEHAHEDAHGEPRAHWSGTRACAIYDLDGTWTNSAPLLTEPEHPTRGGGRWYPTLLTLSDGDILAVGGHPLVSDTDPDQNDSRHGAWLPERYNLASDTWSYQPGHWLYVQWSNVGPTDPETLEDDDILVLLPDGQERGTTNSYLYYPRLYLVPDGRVFMVSTNEGVCGWYDPTTGLVDDMTVTAPNHGSGFAETNHTAVLLPLLPGDNYQAHILFLGMQGPQRITLDTNGETAPQWQATAERDWQDAPPLRRHGCATLLPTGEVIFTGGINNDAVSGLPDTDAVKAAEIYQPGINWGNNQIDFAEEAWVTTPEASVERNYHSVALLLPNGRVLTAGSNIDGAQGGDVAKEFRIEIYTPEYFYSLNRPNILSAPSSLTYEETFVIQTTRIDSIQRVALMRCGSVTHAWDGDQRYVGLDFSVSDAGLNAISPPNGNIAPPGPYMLWVIDDENRPCQLALFVVLS